jgi:hypothetical protein
MPCPGCRAMIDARDKLCPRCGVDTDAKLAPASAVLFFVAFLAVVGVLWAVDVLPPGWALGIVGATVVVEIGFWLKRRRSKR